ncbi:hypothetical protein A0K93_00560 [Corynebacterium sp. BCW_4722]|nr:hypothetical protein A0K93_00560 [Corynebacterium sp. BCW_4722]
MKKTAIAIAASLALVTPLAAVPQALADVVKVGSAYRIDQDDATGAFNGVLVRPGAQTDLTYSHPFSVPGTLTTVLQTSVYLDQKSVELNEQNTVIEHRGNTVTATSTVPGSTITREVLIDGPRATITTEVTPTSEKTVQVDMSLRQWNKTDDYRAEYANGSYKLTPVSPGYEIDMRFGDGAYATTASKDWGALNAATEKRGKHGAAEGAAGFQRGRWLETVAAGETLTGTVTISMATQQDAADTDGDGLPDIWEESGVTLPGGEYLNLRKMGADPQRKDLFLQLNWMPSEWEQRGCAEGDRFDATAGEYRTFAECAAYNKNVYRPSRKMLQDLERLFDANGVNLHIDAGALYAPGIAPQDRRGGVNKEKLPYKKYVFEGTENERGEQLKSWRTELLGDRGAVWHVGVIGDKMLPPPAKASTGLGLQGESFFVAKGAGIKTDKAFVGTILHEFGHVLGLDHDGARTDESMAYYEVLKDSEVGERNYIPEYRSAMNYLYQFDHFDLTKSGTTKAGPNATSGQPLYKPCPSSTNETLCFVGEANIPSDWANLVYRSEHIGNAEGIVGLPEQEPQVIEEDITAYELAVIAAENNNRTAGLTINDDVEGGNGLVVGRDRNPVSVTVSNQGIDAHTFNVVARYDGGQTKPVAVSLAGVTDEKNHAREISIDLGPLKGIEGRETSVEFVITNEAGTAVFEREFGFPVLNYTTNEAAAVLKQVEASAKSEEEKAQARKRLQQVAEPAPTSSPSTTTAPTTTKRPTIERPTPNPAPSPTAAPTATPKPTSTTPAGDTTTDGSSVDTGVIVGIVLALLGAVAAGVGWWYNNGGQLPF